MEGLRNPMAEGRGLCVEDEWLPNVVEGEEDRDGACFLLELPVGDWRRLERAAARAGIEPEELLPRLVHESLRKEARSTGSLCRCGAVLTLVAGLLAAGCVTTVHTRTVAVEKDAEGKVLKVTETDETLRTHQFEWFGLWPKPGFGSEEVRS